MNQLDFLYHKCLPAAVKTPSHRASERLGEWDAQTIQLRLFRLPVDLARLTRAALSWKRALTICSGHW